MTACGVPTDSADRPFISGFDETIFNSRVTFNPGSHIQRHLNAPTLRMEQVAELKTMYIQIIRINRFAPAKMESTYTDTSLTP